MTDPVDVLIVGAGPVGLLLACELARDGAAVRIVERSEKRTYFCKALGITARTLEIFDSLDIAEAAIDAGLWLRGIHIHQDGKLASTFDLPIDLAAQGLPYGTLSLAQFEVERILEDCLVRHGLSVEYGHELVGFRQNASYVDAVLHGPAGEQALRCRWLVGCDGAHSAVRHELGVAFEGDRYPETFVLGDLDLSWSLPRGPMHRFNRSAASNGGATSLAVVPIAGAANRYRLSMIVPEGVTLSSDTPGLDELKALMLPLLPQGTDLSSPRWSSTYRVSHRLAARYGVGRVFLAGDAVHIHPPVGGQGMNTGLQDAHNLAWKLALASRGAAGPALLESYEAERRPVGLDVVANTTKAMNNVLAQHAELPGFRETQLLIGYRDSTIVRDDRPDAGVARLAAGDRAPDADGLTRPFVGHAERLHRRLGRGRHVLIGHVGDREQLDQLADLLDHLRKALGRHAEGVAIVAADSEIIANERIPLLHDSRGQFSARYGVTSGTAWLIRPDGHIGWCSDRPSASGLEAYLRLIR
jgi:2-polyprenyl-6-methoxyphenol hydroxylase-like FAD-dependent oxidoreductase